MDIAKIEKFDLALLNDDVVKIAKYHEQIVTLKKPSVPPERPNYLVLSNTTGLLEENVFMGIGLASFLPLLVSTGFLMASTVNGTSWELPLTFTLGSVAAIVTGIINTIRIEAGAKPSTLCSIQRAWVTMGLPAKRLHALEKKLSQQRVEFIREFAAYEKKVSKITKQAAPLIEAINAKSLSHKFTFGEEGLVSTKRNLPSSLLDLALESERISSQKQIEV